MTKKTATSTTGAATSTTGAATAQPSAALAADSQPPGDATQLNEMFEEIVDSCHLSLLADEKKEAEEKVRLTEASLARAHEELQLLYEEKDIIKKKLDEAVQEKKLVLTMERQVRTEFLVILSKLDQKKLHIQSLEVEKSIFTNAVMSLEQSLKNASDKLLSILKGDVEVAERDRKRKRKRKTT